MRMMKEEPDKTFQTKFLSKTKKNEEEVFSNDKEFCFLMKRRILRYI